MRANKTTVAQMDSVLQLTEIAELLGCVIEGQRWDMGMSWDEAYTLESGIIRAITAHARRLNNERA